MEYGQRYFLDDGYHRTAAYAGGGLESNPARDFTKCVDANNCVECAFRYQGVIATDKDDGAVMLYKLIVQVPEPNPEVFRIHLANPNLGILCKMVA